MRVSVLMQLMYDEGEVNRFLFPLTGEIMQLQKEKKNQRLPGACNRSPGSKLLSLTTQLHCGGFLGGRAGLPDTILEKDHPMTIPSKFGSN